MSGAGAGALGLGGGGIAGVGVDAVDVDRFRRVLDRRPSLAYRCFTAAEQSDAGKSADRAQSLAARFAAKEAVMKALGRGLGAFAWTDVEVRRAPGTGATRNAPSLVLHGAAAALAGEQGAGRFHLSLTHTDVVAIAFVVAEQCEQSWESEQSERSGRSGRSSCAPS